MNKFSAILHGRKRCCSLLSRTSLLFGALMLWSAVAQAQTTYYWKGTANSSFDALSNWSTGPNGTGATRTTRANTDILVFSGGIPSATVDVTRTIGQLKFINSASVTLAINGDITRVINIQGDAAGSDFVLDAGSSLAVVGTVGNNDNAVLNFDLGPAATASIAGPVVFSGSGGNPQSSVTIQLQGDAASAIQFTSGGSLTTKTVADTKLTGSPLGGPNGVAVFGTGSTFQQEVGGDPYGPASFQSGSIYRYVGGTFGAFSAARSYGNLEFANAGATTISGTVALAITNNLTISSSADVTITLTNTAGINIGGNLTLSGAGSSLFFNPGTTRSFSFNGTSAQTIGGVGTLTFGNNARLEINNTSSEGVTLSLPLTIVDAIRFTAGLLNTTSAAPLNLAVGAGVDAAPGFTNSTLTNTSFVNGPITRTTTSATGNVALNTADGTGLFFPIGTPGAYRPISLALAQSSGSATSFTAQVILGPAPTQTFPASTPTSIKRVSGVRHYSVTTNGASAFTAGRITIYYGVDDKVDALSKLRVAKSQASGVWANLGGGATTTAGDGTVFLTGSIQSAGSVDGTTAPNAPFTSLSNFTLASIEASRAAGNNPLPVELTRFAAAPSTAGVALAWATASENNNDRFEVQRSATGEGFETIGTVKGQGTSSRVQDYAFVDSRPLAGLAYYRLRQVDADGTGTYSPVASAEWQRTELAAFPNPTTGTVRLPVALGAVRYRVLNNVGQTLLSGTASANEALDLRALGKGAYFLELTGASGRSTQRLVRE